MIVVVLVKFRYKCQFLLTRAVWSKSHGRSRSLLSVSGWSGFRTYYARVRLKDKAVGIGHPWCLVERYFSYHVWCYIALNAPTITKISGKNVVPGVPVPLNITAGISVDGSLRPLILFWYTLMAPTLVSVISNGAGAFFSNVTLQPARTVSR